MKTTQICIMKSNNKIISKHGNQTKAKMPNNFDTSPLFKTFKENQVYSDEIIITQA